MLMCLWIAKVSVRAVLAFFLVLGLFGFCTGSEEAWFIAGCQAAVVMPATRAGDRRRVAREDRREGVRPSDARRRPAAHVIVMDQECSWRLMRFYHGDYLDGRLAAA